MKRFVSTLAICLAFASCNSSRVRYDDLSPATHATITHDTATIHLGSNLTASACWTHAKSRLEGNALAIWGYRTLHQTSQSFVIKLPPAVNPRSVSIIWINPDGDRVTIPTKP